MRLDKYLGTCGIGTRSEVKKYIRQGWITVNGNLVKKPEEKIDEKQDKVCFRGKELLYEEFLYYVLYKQKNCVTAKSDQRHQTVMDDFPKELQKRLAPVGRLDLDTEGLLLLTDDGTFAHHILSPAHHMPKTYEVWLDREIRPAAVAEFLEGIDIGDDTKTLPAVLEILPEVTRGEQVWYHARLTISEGRYHQVKRMFAAIGSTVLELKRLSIGTLNLDGMRPGEFRKLTDNELSELWNHP